MTARDIFALIIRALGAFSIFKAIETGVWLVGAACGFEMHARNPAITDSFFALSFFVIGLAAVAWADRLAGMVYRDGAGRPLDAADVLRV